MNLISKEELEDLYLIKRMPMHTIAEMKGIAIGSVYKYCRFYHIPTRRKEDTFTMKGRVHTDESKKKISDGNKGKKVSPAVVAKIAEKHKINGIGHKKKRADGYIAIYYPDHPKSNKDGYVMEHDLIMESLIGRHLQENEIVHHINMVRDDNRKENLKLMTKHEHMSFHSKERHQKRRNDLLTK